MKKNIFFAALIAIAFTAAGWLIVLAKVGQQEINYFAMVFTSVVSLLMTWAAMLDAFNDLDDESNTALVTSTYMYIPIGLWFITILIHC